ncbi:hypothetical protein [Mucilaginibacter kameinonensis]|nr:hypothetical protein [Mucilaginibacter kameinonensis]
MIRTETAACSAACQCPQEHTPESRKCCLASQDAEVAALILKASATPA